MNTKKYIPKSAKILAELAGVALLVSGPIYFAKTEEKFSQQAQKIKLERQVYSEVLNGNYQHARTLITNLENSNFEVPSENKFDRNLRYLTSGLISASGLMVSAIPRSRQ